MNDEQIKFIWHTMSDQQKSLVREMMQRLVNGMRSWLIDEAEQLSGNLVNDIAVLDEE